MKARLPLRWVLLLALVWGVSGCDFFESLFSGKAAIVYVDLVDEASKAPDVPVKLDRTALESAMRTVMGAWSDFAFRTAKDDEAKWQVDVRINLVTERTADPIPGQPLDPNRVRRAVGVDMVLRQLSAPEGQESASQSFNATVIEVRNEARSVPFESLAEVALVEAGRRIDRIYNLARSSPGTVIETLGAKEDWLQRAAVDTASTRRLKEAVPALMKIVQDEASPPTRVLPAIGALVSIGDPEAATALIDAGRRKNSAYVAQIVYALSQLGGRDAEGYLFTIQSGHPDPALREAAKEALEELERRRDQAAPSDPE